MASAPSKRPDWLTEAFVKVSFVLHLLNEGFNEFEVSVDGTDIQPELIRRELERQCFTFSPSNGHKYKGVYQRDTMKVEVHGRNRESEADIVARHPDGSLLVAECKGASDPKAKNNGRDRRAFKDALASVILRDLPGSDEGRRVVVVPATKRLRDTAEKAAESRLLQQLEIEIALVAQRGEPEFVLRRPA